MWSTETKGLDSAEISCPYEICLALAKVRYPAGNGSAVCSRATSETQLSPGIKTRPFNDEQGAVTWLNKATSRLKKNLASLDLKQYAKEHKSRFRRLQSYIGDDTVVLEECETGLDDIRAALGLEFFSYISVDEPGLISEYMELYTECEVRKIHAIADRRLSPCALTAGDIAMKGRLLHSPEWLIQEFFPKLKRLIEAWHEHDIKCLFHSDGYVMEVMPNLIEAGIDGLNPIETVAGMDLETVKKSFGDRIFIAGGIDMSQLLSNGTPDQVRKECERAIEIASPGYFIGSTTELDNSSKFENILAMLEVAWKHPLERKTH